MGELRVRARGGEDTDRPGRVAAEVGPVRRGSAAARTRARDPRGARRGAAARGCRRAPRRGRARAGLERRPRGVGAYPAPVPDPFSWHPEPELIGYRDPERSRTALDALGKAVWGASLDYLYDEAF